MSEFLQLPREDQREALLVAAEPSGRPLYLHEKDEWGVSAPHHLFARPPAPHLVLKGGTSLSWAYDVAEHKHIFFAESMPGGAPVDDRAAVTGALDLNPSGDARKTLAHDDQRMVENGLLLDDAEAFDVLLQRCQALAIKVNAPALGAA